MSEKRKIAIPYSDRSEYGLLSPIIEQASMHPKLSVDVLNLNNLVRNVHLGENLGKVYEATYKFFIDKKPDIVIAGFDKIPMVQTALAAREANCVLCQIHAGDIGSNHPDEMNRFIISRLSHILFCNDKESAENLIKLGEENWRIVVSGSTAFDGIDILSKDEFCKRYNLPSKFDLAIYHPDPLSEENTRKDIQYMFENAIDPDILTIVLHPNKDKNWEIVMEEINKHKNDKNIIIIEAFEYRSEYLNAMKYARRLMGNSSSFLYEAPAFNKTVYNKKVIIIGERNKNRKPLKNIKKGGSKFIANYLANLEIDDKLLRKKINIGGVSKCLKTDLKTGSIQR